MMKRFILFTLLVLLVGLVACSSEEKSQTRYQEALQVEQDVGSSKAETLYRELIVDYPDTLGARQARERLEWIKQVREATIRRDAYVAIESLQRVVSGYHSAYLRYPESIRAFDDGEYFFDSSYMAETIANNYTVYLALLGNSEKYLIWSFPTAADFGFVLNGNDQSFVKVNKDVTLKEIESKYSVEAKKNALVFLVAKSNQIE